MYAKINNGVVEKYPYTIGDLRKDNPNTSFPKQIPSDTLLEFGVFEVEQLDPPKLDHTKTWHEVNPVFENGSWKQAYVISDVSPEDLAARTENHAAAVRADRDRRLAETDWTQVADAPVDQAVWATYRQALRDVPAQAGFPWDITWPEKP